MFPRTSHYGILTAMDVDPQTLMNMSSLPPTTTSLPVDFLKIPMNLRNLHHEKMRYGSDYNATEWRLS